MTTIEHYLEDRKEWAESLGVKVYYSPKPFKTIEGGFKATGYFSGDVLFLAMGNKNYLTTAVHEYCHADQWAANTPAWKKCNEWEVQLFEEHIKGRRNFTIDEQKKAIRIIRALELDCEKRVIRQIEKYDLPIDVGTYVQRANAYMFYHSVSAAFRKYATRLSPYSEERVWKTMPKYFLTSDEYDNPSQDFLLRCRLHCY